MYSLISVSGATVNSVKLKETILRNSNTFWYAFDVVPVRYIGIVLTLFHLNYLQILFIKK